MEGSLLLSLPLELRQEIWQLLLASPIADSSSDSAASCVITRGCTKDKETNNAWGRKRYLIQSAHEFDDSTCTCCCTIAEKFRVLGPSQDIHPAILRVCRSVHDESLPYLYRGRAFAFNRPEEYVTLHDRITDMWWLAHRFLVSISPLARQNIHHLRLPMILGSFEIYGCHPAFYTIAPLLPELKSLTLDLCLNAVSVSYALDDTSTETTIHAGVASSSNDSDREDKKFEYWLGPVMAFGDANIKPVYVDKLDLKPSICSLVKTHVETRVWMQFVNWKSKRAERRLQRMREKVAAFTYDDCDAKGLEELVRSH